MVGAAGVEPAVSPKEIRGYSPAPPADIGLAPTRSWRRTLLVSSGVEPGRVLPLGGLAVRWPVYRHASGRGGRSRTRNRSFGGCYRRRPVAPVCLAERRGLEPRRPEGPSAFEAASARPKLGLPLHSLTAHNGLAPVRRSSLTAHNGLAPVRPSLTAHNGLTPVRPSLLTAHNGLAPVRPSSLTAHNGLAPVRPSNKWSAAPDSNWIRVGLQPTASTASAFGAR
jgi:hypothetical protein